MIKKYIKPQSIILDSSLMRNIMFDVNTSNPEEVGEGEVGSKNRDEWQEEPILPDDPSSSTPNSLW